MNHRLSERKKSGLTLPEIILVIVIIVFIFLLLLSRLPRAREDSRATICLANLAQVGQAMLLYCQSNSEILPVVNSWTGLEAAPDTSPFSTFRNELQIGDFVNINAQVKAAKKPDFNRNPQRIAGLRCPSDRTLIPFIATNYRANAGSGARGDSGPFSIAISRKLQEIEKADGLSFTAAITERLIGNPINKSGKENYLIFDICQQVVEFGVNGITRSSDFNSDAGYDWSRGDWRNTLYHHGLTPNWSHSAIARNDNCGQIGASSGHIRSVNVLLMDGSARSWKDSVDPGVWKKLGGISDSISK